jgi:hypothetical protein
VAEAEPLLLLLRRDHALDQRVARALEGAVGGVGRERDRHLVRHL